MEKEEMMHKNLLIFGWRSFQWDSVVSGSLSSWLSWNYDRRHSIRVESWLLLPRIFTSSLSLSLSLWRRGDWLDQGSLAVPGWNSNEKGEMGFLAGKHGFPPPLTCLFFLHKEIGLHFSMYSTRGIPRRSSKPQNLPYLSFFTKMLRILIGVLTNLSILYL